MLDFLPTLLGKHDQGVRARPHPARTHAPADTHARGDEIESVSEEDEQGRPVNTRLFLSLM